MGYPTTPNVLTSPLMVHRGEINASVQSYLQPGSFILISNPVSPGSSGGPVMNIYGEVVGLVSSAFEEKTDYGIISIQAALKSNQVSNFIIESFE